MQIIKHTIDRDGAVTLHFDGGETVQIAADKILLIAQQVEHLAHARRTGRRETPTALAQAITGQSFS